MEVILWATKEQERLLKETFFRLPQSAFVPCRTCSLDKDDCGKRYPADNGSGSIVWCQVNGMVSDGSFIRLDRLVISGGSNNGHAGANPKIPQSQEATV